MAGKTNPIKDYQDAANQLLAINEQRKSNNAKAKMEETIQAAQNNTLAQASEFVATQPRNKQVVNADFNPATKNILRQYGLGQPKIQKTSSSSQQVTKQNIVINNKNTTITNNSVSVPSNSGGPVQGRPIQFQDPGQIKFKTWLSNSFAQQNEMAAKRQREYEKRDSALVRSSNKLMKKLEDMGKTISTTLNPKNMASNMTNQLRTLFMVFGFAALAKNWPTLMKRVDKISSFFSEGGGLVKMFGGKDNETVFQAFKNLFLDKEDGIFRYLRDLIRDSLKERAALIGNIPKPDLKIDPRNKTDIVSYLSKVLTNVTTYLGNILQAIVSPEAAARNVTSQTVQSENYTNTDTYFHEHNKVFSKGRTTLSNGESVKYEDTAGGLFKENGYKGILPGSIERRSDKLIDTPQIEGEISQGLDVARNIKATSKENGYQINTADVAAGLRRLNIKAHETGNVYLDESTLKTFGVDPKEIGAQEVKGKYIVVPRSEDLKEVFYQANLRDNGGLNSDTQYSPFIGGAVNPFNWGAIIGNQVKKSDAERQTKDYQTILIDENQLSSVLKVLESRGTPYTVLENEQEGIYKITEDQMRHITEGMGIKLGDDVESDMNLGNREYLTSVQKFLESKIDESYRNTPEYKQYEASEKAANSGFNPTNILKGAANEAIDQLISSKGLSLGSQEALDLSNKPLRELYFDLIKVHEDLTKKINSNDLGEGELEKLYNEDNKVVELINKIGEFYTYKDAKGNELVVKDNLNKAVLDPTSGSLYIPNHGFIGDGTIELKDAFKSLPKYEIPEPPVVNNSKFNSYFNVLDDYYNTVDKNKQRRSEYWENSRLNNGLDYTRGITKDKIDKVFNLKKVNPSDVQSGDLSGVIEASQTGYFYSNSSDANGEGGNGPMSKHGAGYIQLGKGLNGFMHKCTSGPQTFYYDGSGGKINLAGKWWDTGSPKTAKGTNIGSAGFVPVWNGTAEEGWSTDTIVKSGFELKPGDIMLNFGTSKSGNSSSHAQMWTGDEWISDTHQGNRSFVYKSGRLGDKSAQIWRYNGKYVNNNLELADASVEQDGLLGSEDIELTPQLATTPDINSNEYLSYLSYNPTSESNYIPSLEATFTPESNISNTYPSAFSGNTKGSSDFTNVRSDISNYTPSFDRVNKNLETIQGLLQLDLNANANTLEATNNVVAAIGSLRGKNTNNIPFASSFTDGHYNPQS